MNLLCIESRFPASRSCRCATIPIALACLLPFATGSHAQEAPPVDLEALEQGPIHEAFAEPVALDAEPQPVVPREPPPPIEELPPEAQPEGNNVQWVPGYWKWSEEIADFVWVTGLWRDFPPGREWVPGYWTEAEGGYMWVHGYWGPTEQRQERFLPIPPTTLELGPSSPAPSVNHFWIPGCWIWRTNGYAWRAGYWYVGQPNWVWVPSHYAFTPRGAIYVHGYWDYPLVRRGLLFAPVRRVAGFAVSVGYRWRPYRVLDTSILLTSLYIHGRRGDYFYGHGGWRSPHIYPWYAVNRHRRHYDPLFAYHRWHDGRGRGNWSQKYANDLRRRGPAGNPGSQGGPYRPGARGDLDQTSGRGELVKHVKELPKAASIARRAEGVDRGQFSAQTQRARMAQSRRREIESINGATPSARGNRGPSTAAARNGRIAGGVAADGAGVGRDGRGSGVASANAAVRGDAPSPRGPLNEGAAARRGSAAAQNNVDQRRRGPIAAADEPNSPARRQSASDVARNDLIRRRGPAVVNDGPASTVARDQRGVRGPQGNQAQRGSDSRRVEAARPIIRGNDSPTQTRAREAYQAQARAQWAEAARQRAQANLRARSESSSSTTGRSVPAARGSFDRRETPARSEILRRQATTGSARNSSAPRNSSPAANSAPRRSSGRASFSPQRRGSLRSAPQRGSSSAPSARGRGQLQRSPSSGPSAAARVRSSGGPAMRGSGRSGGRRGNRGR